MGPAPERCLLLVADGWHMARDGLYSVNRQLALGLSRFSGVKVYCALLTSLNNVKPEDIKDADNHNVKLIGTESNSGNLYKEFNANPKAVFPNLFQMIPGVTHIIGHSPITGEGAIKLRDSIYKSSKVLLFYHVLPDDVEWLGNEVSYVIPTETELVKLAEQADVVYSVTEKLHWHFRAKFRNRASKNIDHRLFLPQSSEKIFQVKPEKSKADGPPSIFTLCFGCPASWHGLDIVACAVNKVALAMMDQPVSGPLPKLVIGNVNPIYQEAVKKYVAPYMTVANVTVEYHPYTGVADLQKDLSSCTLAILPCRAEPYGHLALSFLSAGVPCLIAENCAVSSLIKHLTPEPENILVPVTPSNTAVRQDASVWRDRILRTLKDLDSAREQALQLKTALRRDESIKVTHDTVACYCLGKSLKNIKGPKMNHNGHIG